MLIDQVRAFCHQYHLFEPGPVVVAVSGGADSLTLLHVLVALRLEFEITLQVATLDHGLRGESSAQDVAFVRGIGEAWDVPVSAGKADVPALAARLNLGIEAAARKARYDFLAEVARGIGARTIATGHNQNDQAETVLMHVMRGSGLAGLRGILPKSPLGQDKNIALVRPLLATPRDEIDEYLRQLEISPRVDETNTDLTYDRNLIRHRIMPMLEELRGVRRGLARTAHIARDDFDALRHDLPQWSIGPAGLWMPRETFTSLHVARQRLVLRDGINRLNAELSVGFDQLEMLRQKIENMTWQGSLEVAQGFALIADRQTLTLGRAETVVQPFPAYAPALAEGTRLALPGPGEYDLDNGWRLRVERVEARTGDQEQSKSLSTVIAVNPGKPVVLRTRLPGDRFKPQGMGGHSQKLQDFLVNFKVPLPLRDRVPLLDIGGEIAWIVLPTPDGLRSRMAEGFATSHEANDPDELWRFTYWIAEGFGANP